MGNAAIVLSAYNKELSELNNVQKDNLEKLMNEEFKKKLEIIKGHNNETRTLHVIHFNDIYTVDPAYKEEPIGGAARFAYYANKLKKDILMKGNAKVLTLFSGDFVGPSLMSSISKGAHMIEVLNVIGTDYGTFGNHEVDYGYQSLLDRLDGVDTDINDPKLGLVYDYPCTTTKWLHSNMTHKATGEPMGGSKYTSRSALVDWPCESSEDKATIKVGILAVAENWLPGCAQLKQDEIIYEDYIVTAKKYAIELRSKGAEIVLAITHNVLANDYLLTAAVPEIDLLLGGHDHFYKEDLSKRIIKTGEEFRWLSHVTMELPNVNQMKVGDKPIVKLNQIEIVHDIPLSPFITDVSKKYHEIANKKYLKKIFETAVPLDPTEPIVRYQESVLANWVCDIIAEDYSADEGLQSAEIGILQGFNFAGKHPVPIGDSLLGDIMGFFPKQMNIIVVKLSGKDLIKSLQLGASKLPGECGGLHHVSSRLKYKIHILKDPNTKPIIKDVMFDNLPIDLERIFSIAITSELATGKFGYTWFGNAPRVVDLEYSTQLQDLVIMYCNRHMSNTDPKFPINNTIGRIEIIKD